MARTILIHVNVEALDSDLRSGDEIGDLVLAALEVGLGAAPGSLASGSEARHGTLAVCCPLVEEV